MLTCLDHNGECNGSVEYRAPLSSTGRSFPRCDYHWEERMNRQQRIWRDYPDSPIAPGWFSPMDAGESWDEA